MRHPTPPPIPSATLTIERDGAEVDVTVYSAGRHPLGGFLIDCSEDLTEDEEDRASDAIVDAMDRDPATMRYRDELEERWPFGFGRPHV